MALCITTTVGSFLLIGAVLGVLNRLIRVQQYFTPMAEFFDIARVGDGRWAWQAPVVISVFGLYVMWVVSATEHRRAVARRTVHMELTPKEITKRELLLLGASFTAPRAQMLIAAGLWWLFNPRRLRISACETSVITGYRLVLESMFNVACELSEAKRHWLVLA